MAGRKVSAGHVAAVPLHISARSHPPAAAARQTTVAGARTSAHVVLVPLQVSATSQGPADMRQTAPALPGPTATQLGEPLEQSVRPTSQGLPVLHAAPGVQVSRHMPKPLQKPAVQVLPSAT